ncbi:MAG TPA: hypothetical protein VJB13_01430 [Candidatus Nanoarchaeia archaeon]|nr:hypothetical protein [Candidatus Nanoarchaeia archaeon]
MVKLFKDKRGVMDDFTDLLSFALIIFMLGFFTVWIFHTDTADKSDQALGKLDSFHGQEDLLQLISAPAVLENKNVQMKDVILSAVNSNNADLFSQKMQEYFDQQALEGGIAVYDSVAYGAEEEPEPLFSFDNVAFLGKEKGAVYLTNINSDGKLKSIVVKLFG